MLIAVFFDAPQSLRAALAIGCDESAPYSGASSGSGGVGSGGKAYPDWKDSGYGRWATIYKPEGRIIGFARLKYLHDLQEVDLGYRFLPEYWGLGLATEASVACLRYGFEVLNLERIIEMTVPENAASMRVLEKVGMLRGEPFLYEGEPAEHFALSRSRYDEVSRDWER